MIRSEIIYYKPIENSFSEKLEGIIESAAEGERVEVYKDITSLLQRLRSPRESIFLVVLLIPGKDELKDILAFQELFIDKCLVLILPDRDEETIHYGHQLRPRYLSFTDNSMEEIASVLEKLVWNLQKI